MVFASSVQSLTVPEIPFQSPIMSVVGQGMSGEPKKKKIQLAMCLLCMFLYAQGRRNCQSTNNWSFNIQFLGRLVTMNLTTVWTARQQLLSNCNGFDLQIKHFLSYILLYPPFHDSLFAYFLISPVLFVGFCML